MFNIRFLKKYDIHSSVRLVEVSQNRHIIVSSSQLSKCQYWNSQLAPCSLYSDTVGKFCLFLNSVLKESCNISCLSFFCSTLCL